MCHILSSPSRVLIDNSLNSKVEQFNAFATHCKIAISFRSITSPFFFLDTKIHWGPFMYSIESRKEISFRVAQSPLFCMVSRSIDRIWCAAIYYYIYILYFFSIQENAFVLRFAYKTQNAKSIKTNWTDGHVYAQFRFIAAHSCIGMNQFSMQVKLEHAITLMCMYTNVSKLKCMVQLIFIWYFYLIDRNWQWTNESYAYAF